MKTFLVSFLLMCLVGKPGYNLSSEIIKAPQLARDSWVHGSKQAIVSKKFQVFEDEKIPIIPLPNQYSKAMGVFIINHQTPIIATEKAANSTAWFLQKEMLRYTPFPLSIQTSSPLPSIILRLQKINNVDEEAYDLQMTPQSITITATGEKGLFYGVISLLQMIRKSPTTQYAISLACWNIQDSPRYRWRGIMLDEARHFFGEEKVKSLLDWMAFYKLNRFHWHLTDQQGWRIEIKKYPKLTLIGGIGNEGDSIAPAKYYTQEQIKEIVAYAKERHISVIPEIDMPGHADAANRAYPEFSGGGSVQYPNFTFNPGKEGTYQFLANILSETDALFPSQMIHIGGDEVSYGSEGWKTNPDVQSMMKAHNLPDVLAMEHYFSKRMADSVLKMNNKILAWGEVVDAKTPVKETIVFWWRQERPDVLKKALEQGYDVVLCPRLPLYFDFVQDTSHRVGRIHRAFPNDLEHVYAFSHEALPEARNAGKSILGIQANLWTETVITEQRLDYLIFPRICALAEAAWTNGPNKDFKNFSVRIEDDFKLFRKMGVNYFVPGSGDKNEPAR